MIHRDPLCCSFTTLGFYLSGFYHSVLGWWRTGWWRILIIVVHVLRCLHLDIVSLTTKITLVCTILVLSIITTIRILILGLTVLRWS